MNQIPGRLGILQRVLPDYRVLFFDTLAAACPNGLSVYYGQSRPDETITRGDLLVAQSAEGYNHHLLGGMFYQYWQSGVIKWLQSWQPQVLIAEANPRNLRLPSVIRWMHSRNRPVIGWGLGAPPSGNGIFPSLRSSSRRRFVRQFDALITYSQKGANEYQVLGFDPKRIFVAPNAMTPKPARPWVSRLENYNEDTPTLLFVGRLQDRKRVDLLIYACAALDPHFKPRLWIVGEGPVKGNLEALARQVYPNTRFFGSRRNAELEPFFNQADLFILPGTGGLAAQQAMSFALPVMTAEADGTQTEMVRPGNGWQLPPGDLQALVTSLKDALSDPARLRRMGKESFRIVSEEINIEKMVDVFEIAVRSVWKD